MQEPITVVMARQAIKEFDEFMNSCLGIPNTTQRHSDGTITMQTCYVVIDRSYSGDSLFHGVYSELVDAVRVANLNLGSDILKCNMHGVWKQLLPKPKRFKVVQRISLDTNARHLTEQNTLSILNEVEGYFETLSWIKDYCRITFLPPDAVRYQENPGESIKAEIYTQKLQRRPNGEEFMLGGFQLGTIATEVTEYEYCESATGTST